jgi:hypothetical protein
MTAMRTTGHDTTVTIQSLPSFPARPPHLTSPEAATAAARTPGQSPAIISTHRFPPPISRTIAFKGKAMAAVHYYLGRPARVWIAAQSPAAPRGTRATAAGASTAASPASPPADSPRLCPLRRTAQPIPARAAPATGSPP